MLGRATSRIALSVLGVGALGAGTVAMTGTGGGTPRCAGQVYPTVEACQLRHGSSAVCRQNPQSGMWQPDRCATGTRSSGSSGSGYRSSGTGGWWWGGGRGTTTTPTTPGGTTPPTVVGRSPSTTGSPGTTSAPGSTSSRGGFGSTGGSHSSGS